MLSVIQLTRARRQPIRNYYAELFVGKVKSTSVKKILKNFTAGFIISGIRAKTPVSYEIERNRAVQHHNTYQNNE